MSADTMVSTALAEVPKCVAAGIVDMGTGMLLAVKTTESHPQQVMDMLAAATKELFEGDMAMDIEKTFKQTRGDTGEKHYFNEFIVNSQNLIHIFGRVPSSDSIVLVTVCRADANLGLVITKFRNSAQGDSI
jgi:hypothetical protein